MMDEIRRSNTAPNIPKIASVKTAVTIFYTNNELGNGEIKELFDCSTTKAQQLKNFAQEYARSIKSMPRCKAYVSTELAFKAWGLEIDKLEAKLKKAEKLGIAV